MFRFCTLRSTLGWVCAFALVASSAARAIPAAELDDYLGKADDSFSWEIVSQRDMGGSPAFTLYELRLISQEWRGDVWEHTLTIIRPRDVQSAEMAMLVIGGGRNREDGSPFGSSPQETFILSSIARGTNSVVALLSQVPNQPILDGRNEDEAIAHTMIQFMESGEADWPLLFPMVKSAVAAMDAVQEFADQEIGSPIRKFFLTGGSKRGWTSWLAAASDERVAAIAPIVIDNLNMPAQMPHQLASWGAYSPSISDYTDLNIPERMSENDPRARQLLAMMDPYEFIDRLTLPKLIVSSTNDPYWVVDAVRFYYDDLKGEKYIHYCPNTGHDIDAGGVAAISGFYRMVRAGQERPRFSWEESEVEGVYSLALNTEDEPKEVRLWSAMSDDRDFRDATWTHEVIDAGGAEDPGGYAIAVDIPATGYTAVYAELIYPADAKTNMGVCTPVKVLGGDHE